jgi:peptidyl-tRNA hydrolase
LIVHNGSKAYSLKLSVLLKEKIKLLKSQNYLGKPTDFDEVRGTLVKHFTIFYKITPNQIIIVGMWDNRRNPNDLHKNLEL